MGYFQNWESRVGLKTVSSLERVLGSQDPSPDPEQRGAIIPDLVQDNRKNTHIFVPSSWHTDPKTLYFLRAGSTSCSILGL